MRATALLLTLLLALPMAHGLPRLPAEPHANAVAPLLANPTDADLLLALAHHAGHPAQRLPLPPLPPGATVPHLLLDLAHRSGAHHATSADYADFASLDPRVAAPLLTLLHAIRVAWDLRDEAVAPLDAHEQQTLARLVLHERNHQDPAAVALGDQLNATRLIEAAILLLDATETLVLPLLHDAAQSDAWPPTPLADPHGILRLGGTGDDIEPTNRLLQIDPRGNDTYTNNAGGTTLLADLDPTTPDYPISLSIDLAGNDSYTFKKNAPAIGAGFLGIGVKLDLAGDDTYDCLRSCQGAGMSGVGMGRDFEGDDTRLIGDSGIGFGTLLGILREDQGADYYRSGLDAGGSGFGPSATGLLWDRAGMDNYSRVFAISATLYGYGTQSAHGLFTDEGEANDIYSVSHACNDCTWRAGSSIHAAVPPNGRGADNQSLGALISNS